MWNNFHLLLKKHLEVQWFHILSLIFLFVLARIHTYKLCRLFQPLRLAINLKIEIQQKKNFTGHMLRCLCFLVEYTEKRFIIAPQSLSLLFLTKPGGSQSKKISTTFMYGIKRLGFCAMSIPQKKTINLSNSSRYSKIIWKYKFINCFLLSYAFLIHATNPVLGSVVFQPSSFPKKL